MLRGAHQHGVQAALEKYCIKEAAPFQKAISFGRQMIMGELPTVIRQGRKGGLGAVFKKPLSGKPGSGGILHPRNVLWPTIPGAPARTWVYRGMGALPMIGAVQAARGKGGDLNETRFSNTLGALGAGVGLMYGGMTAGMLGVPILGSLGHHAGSGIGRMLSGKPKPPELPPAPLPPRQIPGTLESSPRGDNMYAGPYPRGI